MNKINIKKSPKKVLTDSIKTICTNIEYSNIDKGFKVVLNTSPENKDGKSFISAYIAVTFAKQDKNVLLIDFDIRENVQARIFGVNKMNSKGYTHLLSNFNDKIDISEQIIKTKVQNLSILNFGNCPSNLLELLNSDDNKNLINKLKKEYDVIILDVPPVLASNIGLIMSKYSDANIIVTSKEKTRLDNLEATINKFKKNDTKIDGIIINKVKLNKNDFSYLYNI